APVARPVPVSAQPAPAPSRPPVAGQPVNQPVRPVNFSRPTSATGQPILPAQATAPASTNGNSVPGYVVNGNGNGSDGAEKKEPEKPEPYALTRLLSATRFGPWLEGGGVTVGGWLQGSYTASTASRNNLPVTMNDRANFWQLNQNFFRVAKEVDTSKDEFQWGFRTDWILPGTDARYSIARGLWDGQLKPPGRLGANPNSYPIDLFQAYGEVFLPNLGPKGTAVKVGRFASHVGYEFVQGAETPFLTRGYLFQYNPFTHSGAWAVTPLNDTWTVSNGFSVGADNFFGDPTNRLTYLGQVKWAPKEGKTSATFNVVLNDNNYQTRQNFPLYNVYNLILTHAFTDKLSYALDSTFSHMDNAPIPGGGSGSATWYGAAQYLIYKHTDKLTSTARVELFQDTKGARTGFKGLYTELTYGLAYSPTRSLTFRPTIRYDHNNTSRPFEGKPDLFTASLDVIVRY
ncbi:MAG: outer membrane beta-barrel protein, partial [Gemmataceae bacterium]|nr:outer membrane beta-barrel protein [Gemmataceae bacterium]